MPRKKKTTTITEEIPDSLAIDIEPEHAETLGGEEDNTLANVLSQFGPAGIKIKVSKKGPKGAAYCFSTDEEVDEDFVQANYGGGTYVCRIFINGEYKQSVTMNIAERLLPNGGNGNGNGGGSSQSSMAEMQAQLMREQNAFLMQLVNKAMGGGGVATPVGELTEAMAKVHQMTGGGGAASQMEVFIKGFELAKDFQSGNSDKDWKSELLDTIKEIAKPILPVLAGEFMRKNGSAPMQTGEQNQLGAGAISNTPTDITAEVRDGIVYLKKKVLQNIDVNLILDWIVANASDYQKFLHVVLTTDFAKFAQIDAEIANEPFATWFKNLYDGLRQAFSQSDSLADDSGEHSGDAGNVVSHAQFGGTGGKGTAS